MDDYNLNNHEAFELLRESVEAHPQGNQDLMAFKDGMLLIWNQFENVIIAVNLRFVRDSNTPNKFQRLFLSTFAFFEITKLLINESGSQCALIGPNGVMVIQIPRRWGPKCDFEGGKPEVFCKSVCLEERLPRDASGDASIRQVRWFPGAANDDVLVALTSDSELLMYLTYPSYPDGYRLLSKCEVGPGALARRPCLTSLGDFPIDFDFALADDSSGECDWMIVVLFGNGDVFIVTEGLKKSVEYKTFDRVLGPLAVYPAVSDNYGVDDACSVLVLRSTPPIVVIATSTGTLYHSLLVPKMQENKYEQNGDEESDRAHLALLTIERVDLELGFLQEWEASNPDEIRKLSLLKDPTANARYFCTHEAGVHVVVLPIVNKLELYYNCDEDKCDSYEPSLSKSQTSAQYLICTRVNSSSPEKSDRSRPLGLAVTEAPSSLLISLFSDGRVLSYPMPVSATLPPIPSITLPGGDVAENADSTKKQSDDFLSHIHAILQSPLSKGCKPLLRLSSNQNISSKEKAEICAQGTAAFRENYFPKYRRTIEEIEKRVRTLSMIKAKQLEELNELEAEKKGLQSRAEQIAEKYDELAEKQLDLRSLCRAILTEILQRQPGMTNEENKLLETLKSYESKVKQLCERVSDLQYRREYQQQRFESKENKIPVAKLKMSEMKSQNKIQRSLAEMTKEIADLEEVVKDMKQKLESEEGN